MVAKSVKFEKLAGMDGKFLKMARDLYFERKFVKNENMEKSDKFEKLAQKDSLS